MAIKRSITPFAVGALLLASTNAVANPTNVVSLDYLGKAEIASGTEFNGTTVGGLSGIIYDPRSGEYLAVSDDRSVGVDARFYNLTIDLTGDDLADGDVVLTSVTSLTDNGGTPLSDGLYDFEGITFAADGSLIISSEGRPGSFDPFIDRFTVGGQQTGNIPVPTYYNAGPNLGARSNLGFESLTRYGNTLFAATEGALEQDGPRASVGAGSPARILTFDATTGELTNEFIYEVDPIAVAPNPSDAFADSGLVELLAIDDDTLLALERSFSIGAPERGYTGKIYLVELSDATSVLDDGDASGNLQIPGFKTAEKTLIGELQGDYGIENVDNIEGMTFGPKLSDGRYSLIIASDDNFSAFGPQANQFLAFAVNVPEPSALALMGMGSLMIARRRRS